MNLRRSIAALVAVMGFVLQGAAPAFADAKLEKSDPAEDASLTAVPAALTLTFNEPVNPQSLALTGPDGQAVTLAAPTTAQLVVTQPVPALANGAYALAFKVVSTDGHNVSGTIKFTVAAPVPTTTTTTTTTQPPVVSSAPAVQNQAAENSSTTWWVVGAAVALVLAAVAYGWIRQRRA
ncbi:copper resistance CopC family protein [Lentzea sp. NPDC054927]